MIAHTQHDALLQYRFSFCMPHFFCNINCKSSVPRLRLKLWHLSTGTCYSNSLQLPPGKLSSLDLHNLCLPCCPHICLRWNMNCMRVCMVSSEHLLQIICNNLSGNFHLNVVNGTLFILKHCCCILVNNIDTLFGILLLYFIFCSSSIPYFFMDWEDYVMSLATHQQNLS